MTKQTKQTRQTFLFCEFWADIAIISYRRGDTYFKWRINLDTGEDWAWITGLLNLTITPKDIEEKGRVSSKKDLNNKYLHIVAPIPEKDIWGGKYVFQALSTKATHLCITTDREKNLLAIYPVNDPIPFARQEKWS